MSFTSPLQSLLQARIDGIRDQFDAAVEQLTTVLNAIEEFSDGLADSASRPQSQRELLRTVRDFDWNLFSAPALRTAEPAWPESRRDDLRDCIEQLRGAVQQPGAMDGNVPDDVIARIELIRRELSEARLLRLQQWNRRADLVRTAAVVVAIATAAGTGFLALSSGLQVAHQQPLAPTPDYEPVNGLWQLKADAREGLMSRYGSALRQFSPMMVAPLTTLAPAPEARQSQRGDSEAGGYDAPIGATIKSLFEGEWETHLANRSYVYSEYLGVLVYRIRLLEQKPFPWDEVFPDPQHEVTVTHDSSNWTSRVLADIRHSGNAPLLIRAVARHGDYVLGAIEETVISAETSGVILLKPEWIYESRWAVEMNSEPQPQSAPGGVAPAQPPPGAVPLPDPNLERIEAGSVVEVVVEYEFVNGETHEKRMTFPLDDALLRVPREVKSVAAQNAVARLLGKATKIGEASIRVFAPVELEDIVEGEVRSSVVPINEFLAPGGRLAVRTKFMTNVSGRYEFRIAVDEATVSVHQADLLGTDIAIGSRGWLSVEEFRRIQTEHAASVEYRQRQASVDGSSP